MLCSSALRSALLPVCVYQDYTYYGLASPWLQVKCLRVLQYFPPPEEPVVHRMLVDVVKRILGGTLTRAPLCCCGSCSCLPSLASLAMGPDAWASAPCRRRPALPTLRAPPRDTLRLCALCAGSEPVKNVNKNNAVHAIVFEAVAVAIALDEPELCTLGERQGGLL